jgi:hypothetical protein
MATTMIRYEIADVHCMLCGRLSGTAKREGRGAQLFYRGPDGGEWQAVRGVSALRCASCHGSLFLDEFDVKQEFTPEAFAEEDAARPRRGRPPRPFRIPSRAA